MTSHHSFVRRLCAGLGVLIATSLLALVATVISEQRLGAAMARSSQALALLEDLMEVQIGFSAARAAEREFLLEDLRTPGFFKTGSSPALERHHRAMAELDVLLRSIEERPAAREVELEPIRESVSEYRERFGEVVRLQRQRGSLYTGLLGEMKEATFAFQELLEDLDARGQTLLRSELLELIRDHGEYLRDLDNRPRFLVGERIAILHEEIDGLGHSQPDALHAQVEAFDRAWRGLLEIDDRIGRSSGAGLRGELRGAQERAIPLTIAAVERARAGFEAQTRTVERTAAAARQVTTAATALAVALSVFLAVWLGRQLRGSLAAVLAAVEAYGGGNRSARVGSLPRRDEFAVLGETFDHLAETLAEATEELEEMNASLELAVKGDTAGLLDRIKRLTADAEGRSESPQPSS